MRCITGPWSLLCGLSVTFKYFIDPRRIVTEQYPENKKTLKMHERYRGRLEMIEDAINKSGIRLDRESVYYFTGGGIMTMKDARFYVTDKLKHNVREGKAKIDKLKPTQIYASGSGLLELVFNMIDADEQPNGLLERIRRFFRKG